MNHPQRCVWGGANNPSP